MVYYAKIDGKTVQCYIAEVIWRENIALVKVNGEGELRRAGLYKLAMQTSLLNSIGFNTVVENLKKEFSEEA